jgi:polyribonucleotide nucleotidyltransferase
VNALTLALQNAGIPMRDMVCACTVGLHDTTPLLDLNFSERSSETPELVLASLVHSKKIVLVQEENKVNLKELPKMMELALEGNQKIYEVLKQEVSVQERWRRSIHIKSDRADPHVSSSFWSSSADEGVQRSDSQESRHAQRVDGRSACN